MDQESRDANSLLVELDRGLQSQNIGDQIEAVVRFSGLFQRYPLPVLINSACLKLAEAFRCGSNFIRVQICEVFERNQSHLNKIYNVDDFYRHLFTVTTSNDPIARSITLLTLGHIAPVVSHHKGIHHCISSSLESTVECELNATIACAASYVKYSSEFACNIFPNIVSIIDSKKSSIDVKIRALAVLDHGFYNANDAMTVRAFLIDVIAKTQVKKLVSTCLTLSTKIAFTSLSHITAQIELLLRIFLNDSHNIIKASALKNLFFLATNSPHIWESSHVTPLVTHLELLLNDDNSDRSNMFVEMILLIFCKLLTCECNFISQEEKNRIFQQCYKLSLNNRNLSPCSMAFKLMTIMSEERYHSTKDMIDYPTDDITNDTLTSIKTFLTQATAKSPKSKLESHNTQANSFAISRTIYRNIARLCQLNPQYCSELLKLIFNRISAKDSTIGDSNHHHTELMCAVLQYSNDLTLTPENCWKLLKSKSSDMSNTNFLNISVLYFQTVRMANTTYDFPNEFIEKVTRENNSWFAFRVMRQAMRYGHFKVAGQICHHLHGHASTDTIDFYFKSLGRICAAESSLQSATQIDIDSNLKAAIALYEDSVSPLRASIGHSRTTNFQLQFLWLRVRTLQAHSDLRQCCKMYEISPITYSTLLSAIGAVRGPGCDQNVAKFGTIQQMPKIAKDFRYLGECYENLSLVSFDCDTRTLDYLYLLKSSCIIMADVIDAVFQYGKNLPVISKLSLISGQDSALEYKRLESTCNQLLELTHSEVLKPGLFPSQKSIQPIIVLIRTFSDELLRCHFTYPRYFFQPLQETRIKLAISPQASCPLSNSINLLLGNNLVLKVEGLIQSVAKAQKLIRKVCKVIISVTMSPANNNVDSMFFQSTATPHINYFKTEFLLPLRLVGSFNIDIDVSLMDEHEQLWKNGPTEKLDVVVS